MSICIILNMFPDPAVFRANVLPSTVEVQFKNLTVDAMIFLGNRSVPTVLNSYRNFFEASSGSCQQKAPTIIRSS